MLIGLGIIIIFLIVLAIQLAMFTKSSAEISRGEPISEYTEEKSALLVIDIQEGTTGKYSTTHEYQNKASSLIFQVNQLIDTCAARNIPVVYIVNEVTNPWINFINNSMKKGTAGTMLDRNLNIISENIFYKEKRDAFSNSKLDDFLVNNKINHLYIAGLDAAFCIKNTVQAALNRNYQVTILEDVVISKSDNDKQAAISEMIKNGANSISSLDFPE
jgi:nicotinamidase-related amidase